MRIAIGLVLACLVGTACGFVVGPFTSRAAVRSSFAVSFAEPSGKIQDSSAKNEQLFTDADKSKITALVASTPIVFGLFASLPAQAAADGGMFPVLSALTAYLHYAGMLSAVGCLVAERLLLQKTNFNEDDEDLLTKIDIAYGIIAIPIFVSGYYRVTQYGKGFDFYKHEPFFWFKIALAGILAASSFFPTGTIIKRAAEKKDSGIYTPMPETLQNRMKSVVNAELTGIAFIPLAATLMARGVGYTEDFPWEVEAGLAALVFAGASFKYVKDVFSDWSGETSLEEASNSRF